MNKLWTPDKEENNVISLAKPVTGGGNGPRQGRKWLREIEVDEIFLVKDSMQKQSPFLTSFHLVAKTELSALLYNPEMHKNPQWADIEDFSNRFIFQEVTSKVINDDSSRTIQQSTVENTGSTEVLD